MPHNTRASRYLLELLRCSIYDTSPGEIAEGLSWHDIHCLAMRHGVGAMAFHGLRERRRELDPALSDRWNKDYASALTKASNQSHEFALLSEAFSRHGISFAPLKGCCMNEIYPIPELREMSDLDILVHPEDMNTACALLCSLGYTLGSDNGNHVVMKKLPYLCVELHRNLIAENYEFHDIFRDPWQFFARREGAHRHEMRLEDFYLFLLAHGAKHYYNRGTGIRTVLDVHMFLRRYEHELDQSYLGSRLSNDRLREFRMQIESLAANWFGDAEELDSCAEEMAYYILSGAVYGTAKGHSIQYVRRQVEKGNSVKCAKISYFLHMAFLPCNEMRLMYPTLDKAPVLLPLFWIHRWCRILICKPDSVAKRYRQAKNISYYEKQERR